LFTADVNFYLTWCCVAASDVPWDIDLYSGEPSGSSTCINLDIAEEMDIGAPLMFEGSASIGAMNALMFDISDDAGMGFSLTEVHLGWINGSFDLGLSHGIYEITAIDWTDNPGCDSLMVQQSFIVARYITRLDASTLLNVAVANETELELTAWTDGSCVVVSAKWDDDTVSTTPCDEDSENADLSVLISKHVYAIPGTYTFSVTASNLVSSKVAENQTISVYERIHDLTMYGNSSVNAAQDMGTWGVAAGPDQRPLENIVCVWNMGTNYGDTVNNVAMLNTSKPHEITFNYVPTDTGTQTISVNCSNAVSSQVLTMEVTVVWDNTTTTTVGSIGSSSDGTTTVVPPRTTATTTDSDNSFISATPTDTVQLVWDNVTLGELTCNSSTLWEYPIICQLTIVRFGTGACFEWDMGDGNPLVYYQDGYCAATVPAASPTYVQVRLGQYYSSQQFADYLVSSLVNKKI